MTGNYPKFTAVALLAGLIWSGAAEAETFVETFNTTSYKDTAQTTAVWDTAQGLVYLSSNYTFSQPGGLVNWGGEIKAIHHNGEYYLLGGRGGKLNRYDGTTWTNCSTGLTNIYGDRIGLTGFGNSTVNSIGFYSDLWLIGGSGKTLNSYDGTSFTDLAGSLASWTSQDINAVRYGGGSTEQFWLIAGAGGRLNRYNGSVFTSLSGSANYFANTTTAYAVGFDGTYWLIGGDGGSLCRYQNGTFAYLNPGFGSTGYIYAAAASGSNSWLIGGIGSRKLVSYNGSTFTDLSSNIGSMVTVRSIRHNGSFWVIAGIGSSQAPIVYTYNGSSWNGPETLSGFGSANPVYAVEWNATGSEWLVGGGQARLNRRTGTYSSPSYADRSAQTLDLGVEIINAVSANTSTALVWLGGNNGTLNLYNGSTFTDLVPTVLSSTTWGTANVLAIGNDHAGGNWLIGGSAAKLVRYNGTSSSEPASGFTGSITAIHWDGSGWLIGGTDGQLKSYDGASTFTTLSLSGIFGAGEDVTFISSGGGTWLIGGDAGSVASYDGVGAPTALYSPSGFTAVNAIGYGLLQNSYHRFVIGGTVAGDQQVRVYDLDSGDLGWVSLSNFGSNAVKTIRYSQSQGYWFIGGAGRTLNTYDWNEAVDWSGYLLNFGSSSINALAWNGEYWLLGGGEARVNRYSPVYDQPRWAQSLTVASDWQNFTSVTLTAAESLPAGTGISYFVTANGQLADPHTHWVPVTPGVVTSFSGGEEGPLLKWKAELWTTPTNQSPRLDQINLEYVRAPTLTLTPTATRTATQTRTASPTLTPTPTISATSTPTPTITYTPTMVIFSSTPTPTATRTSSYTVTPTETQTATETPFVTETPTATISVTETWTPSPTPTPNPQLPFLPGTLIIPMDIKDGRTNQNYAMFRAYGLVYRLLLDGIPVYWSIVSPSGHYKYWEEDDFTCSQSTDLIGNTFTTYAGTKYARGTTYSNPVYNGGPFLIAVANSAAAMAVITEWNTRFAAGTERNQAIMVHQYTGTGTFSANIYRKLRAAPKMAVFETYQGSPNGDLVCYAYLNNARFVSNQAGYKWWSSTNTLSQWSRSAPDTFTAAELAGTTSDHQDGALFNPGHGLPKYSVLLAGHWDGRYTGAGGTLLPDDAETIAEVETFLHYPSIHFFAQCIAVNTFENDLLDKSPMIYGGHGRFLSTGGLSYTGANVTRTANVIAHYPVAQAVGLWGRTGYTLTGAQTGYGYLTYTVGGPSGQPSIPWGGDSTAVHIRTTQWYTPTAVPTPYDSVSNMFMSNWAWGDSAYGKISYLCTHQSNSSSYPYYGSTSNISGVGARYFYNCLFESPAVSLSVPEMYLTLTAPGQAEVGGTLTYTLTYQNLSGIAYDATLTLPDPVNAVFQSASGGGIHGAGSVTWSLGTLDIGAGGSVTITYLLNSSGGAGWDAQANVAYKSGQTDLTAYSNSVHTAEVVYTQTSTPTPSATMSRTWTATATLTPSPTPTPTLSPTPSQTQTSTVTWTATPTATITETATISPTSTHSPVVTPTPTATISATYTVSATYTASPTATPSDTATPTLTATGTGTLTPTLTPTSTRTLTVTPSPTPSATPVLPTLTPTPTTSPTPQAVATPGRVYVYPNPFRPDQAVGYVLKFDNVPPASELRIFTVSGELVRAFLQVEGRVTWDGKNAQGSDVVSGVYLYLVKSGEGSTQSGKLFVIR